MATSPQIRSAESKPSSKSRWKLFEAHFRGPGEYKFGPAGKQIILQVAEDRTFMLTEPPPIPLYVIADAVKD